MATPPLYKFYFLDGNGQYFTVVSGNVKTTATETELPESPRGWDAMKIQFTRDEAGAGVFAKSIEPLEWWGDAAQILRYLWESPFGYHFDAYCRIIIKRRNNLWTYDTFLDATLDFSTADDSTKAVQLINDVAQNEEPFFKIGIIKNSLLQTLQNNDGTDFEIAFDSDAKTINHDGTKIGCEFEWRIQGLADVEIANNSGNGYVFPMALVKREGEEYINNTIIIQSQPNERYNQGGGVGDTPSNSAFFLNTSKSFTAAYTLEIEINASSNGADNTLFVDLGRKNTITDQEAPFPPTNLAQSAVYNGVTVFTLTASGNITFDPGRYNYYLTIRNFSVSGGTVTQVEVLSCVFNLQFNNINDPTDITAFRYPDFAKKLFITASNNTATFASGYLNYSNSTNDFWNHRLYNNYPYNTMVTCGDAIRVKPTPKIKSSIADCKLDMFSRWMLGWGINGNEIRVEHLSYFFNRYSEIASLGQVKGLKKSVATDFIYSDMHVGYADQEYNLAEGRDEVNSEANYKLPVRTITRTQELISPYRADIYGIELQRAYGIEKDTTDNKGDNDTFLMEVEGTPDNGKYNLKRLTGHTYGVSFPDTVYNEGLRPSRFVRRHSPFIRSFLNVKDTVAPPASTMAYFQSAKKNAQAFTLTSGAAVYEGQNWYVAEALSLQYPRLFLPVYYEFEFTPIENLLSLIENNPYGYIEFEDNNTTYRGFILDVTIESANDDVYQFKLLGCPM